MTSETLVTCLRAVQPPAGVEEWLRAIQPVTEDVPPSEDYRRAVRDVLAMLGVLSGTTGEVTSPMAYYFVQSWLCSIQDGAFKPATWQGSMGEDCGGGGARLVHVLEENRLACCANPTPLRIVQAVTAVIKARRDGSDVYLMQYDQKARQFQPIGGKQEVTDASSEAALTRELCEELSITSLRPGQDFQIHPLVEHRRLTEVSGSLHVITQYDHSFYHLTDIRFPVKTDHWTRWITASELAAGRTSDGYAITALFEDIMPGVLPTLGTSFRDAVP
jgi:8-oxo-dGTP pyrophosphatase MutT (NUDIX family)